MKKGVACLIDFSRQLQHIPEVTLDLSYLFMGKHIRIVPGAWPHNGIHPDSF